MHSRAMGLIFGEIRFNFRLFAAYLKSLNHFVSIFGAMENIFDKSDAENFINRINQLTPETQPQWGKMSVDQMLAHCNIGFEMAYEPEKYPTINPVAKFFLKFLIKSTVVGDKPYEKNGRTAPDFIIEGSRDFELEKKRLIENIKKTNEMGIAHFEGKSSRSLGKLSAAEWNVSFSKHLNHHLSQFSV